MKQNPVTSSWLQAPVFEEDGEKTRRAQLVNFTSISLTGMAILLLSGMILSGNPFDYVTLNICLGILSGVVHYILIRRGLVNFVSLSQLILGFIYTTAIVTCLGTVNTPVSYGFLVFTVGAWRQLGWPGLALAAGGVRYSANATARTDRRIERSGCRSRFPRGLATHADGNPAAGPWGGPGLDRCRTRTAPRRVRCAFPATGGLRTAADADRHGARSRTRSTACTTSSAR